MNIFFIPKNLRHIFISGEHGGDAQLNLTIIKRGELIAFLRYKTSSDSPPELGFYRQVLQVGVERSKPSRRGSVLNKMRMQPSVVLYHLRYDIYVCRKKFLKFAITHNLSDDRITFFKLFENRNFS